MSRYTLTLLGLVLMTGFGIFFGVEIASRGMERIQGPVMPAGYQTVESAAPNGGSTAGPGRVGSPGNTGGAQSGTAQTQTGAATNAGTGGGSLKPGTAAGGQALPAPTPTPLQQPVGAGISTGAADSNVNKLGNGIGDLLQGAARQTIRAVVGLFDGLLN